MNELFTVLKLTENLISPTVRMRMPAQHELWTY